MINTVLNFKAATIFFRPRIPEKFFFSLGKYGYWYAKFPVSHIPTIWQQLDKASDSFSTTIYVILKT